ncbi:MAG: hypothetical protein Q9167_004835 [Letrouitia subvulpina]
MAKKVVDYLQGIFAPKPTPSQSVDDDFGDYAAVPDPSPASITPSASTFATDGSTAPTSTPLIPYTKWYRIWERTSPRDFYQEAVIMPFIILIVGLHIWGRRKNRRKARAWITAHGPAMQKEFAVVGYGGKRSSVSADNGDDVDEEATGNEDLMREKTAMEFTSYATGRLNVASLELKLSLFKRYNPLTLMIESALGFLFESVTPPAERMEATSYVFDGKERDVVPVRSKAELDNKDARFKGLPSSSYDNFVWALVHKERMKRLRDDRYDISLTATRDHSKLPPWLTTMSESAEITEQMLRSEELVKAAKEAGDSFEYLIISDQPAEKPNKLADLEVSNASRKRIYLSLSLPPKSTHPSAYKTTLPLFTHFLRLADTLVSHAHFRPEVTKKIKATREEEVKKLRVKDESEKADERRLESEKRKKGERDARVKGLSAEEQRKFLEREREREIRKGEKKMSRKA